MVSQTSFPECGLAGPPGWVNVHGLEIIGWRMRKQSDSDQFSLFGPSYQVEAAVKAAMRRAAKASDLSRELIADRMNAIADDHGMRLTTGNSKKLEVATLEKWLNPASEHVPPLRALVVFCRVVESSEPLAALAAPLGMQVIDQQQAKLLRRAELEAEIERLKREKRRIEAGL